MEQSRIFNFTDGYLIQKSKHFVRIANRDKITLTGYGMPDTLPDETITLRYEFTEMPTDEEMLAPVEEATAEKNNVRDEVKMAIKDIVNRAELCFGKSSPTMKRFKTGSLDRLKDNELYRVSGTVLRAANCFLDKLSTNGVTAEMLANTKAKNTTFDGLIDQRDDLEIQRNIATAIRIETANNLYKNMVKISEYGKSAFEGKDVVKAAEYLLGE